MKSELPVFSRLKVARMQWQAALVAAKRAGAKDVRAMAALRRAESAYQAAHVAAQQWRAVPDPATPRFRRMPKVDPYAVPERSAYQVPTGARAA